MSIDLQNLPDDPAVLKAMIAALQAENAKISATLRVHDQLVQALRLRIAKLQKLAFGKSSEKIEREIKQLELALEDLLIAVAEEDDAPIDEGQDEPAADELTAPALRRRPRVSDATLRERRELDPGTCCSDCGGDLRVVGEDEELMAFFDFPAQHWQSIRTSNPIESAFATIRHRTKRSKGCLTRNGMLHMMFKLGQCAEQNWRKLRGFDYLAKVITGITFKDGIETQNPDQIAA